jgi:S-adenosylmethionine:tRNA ribosyltransferase-isomerase
VPGAPLPGDRTSDYDYDLPEELIAQEPVEPRDASRLLVVDRASGALAHRRFTDIVEYFAPGDTLVVNATRVFRARLLATRDSGAPAEIFLQRALDGDTLWEAMVQPGSKVKPGRTVHVAPGFDVEIVDSTPRHTRVVRLRTDPAIFATASAAIEACGHVPLPPYITRADTAADAARYQTVYAHTIGSVAAPTAGLHFTPTLLDALAARGVERVEVVLHVGAGTFRPIQDEDPSRHLMHEEWCDVSPEAAAALAATRARGGRVWAVGTTAVRTLESACDTEGVVHAGARDTNLFIRPPRTLRAVDRLITNFHQPRSTLLMLVASATGYTLMRQAYTEAVHERYRFLSYGDAMCIL